MKEIIVALITGGLSLIGVIITVAYTSRKSNTQIIEELKSRSDMSDAKLDKEVALLRAEVDELMREVRIHNNFAQRMPVVENEVATLKKEVDELRKG